MNEAKLFAEQSAADYCAKLANAETGGQARLIEAEIQSKDGTTIPVRVSLTPIELYGRDLVLALMADITERKRAEALARAGRHARSRARRDHRPQFRRSAHRFLEQRRGTFVRLERAAEAIGQPVGK